MASTPHALRRLAAAPADSGPDPLVQELVDRTVAPYAALLTPAEEDELRELLEAVLLTHPAMAPAVEQLRRLRSSMQSEVRAKRRGGAG